MKKYYYFLGIGGIGMSALARYFNLQGATVFGYDRTSSDLTQALQTEGIAVHYEDSVSEIPDVVKTAKDETIVVITPAIPKDNAEYNYLKDNGFTILKRAQVLGHICENKKTVAIAGTHGKTSTTTFTSYLLNKSSKGCNAFLGGISKNFNSNFVYDGKSELIAVEADEFDRSFHNLYPSTAVITAMDADHLDIYGTHEAVIESFYQFVRQIKQNGVLIHKLGLNFDPIKADIEKHNVTVYTYSLQDDSADFYMKSVEIKNNAFELVLHTPFGDISDLHFCLPGKTNVENLVAASAASLLNGLTASELQTEVAAMQGVVRRFDVHVANDNVIYIDDYAHHPAELKACIESIREMYAGKKLTGIFQPHLYTRTRDFASDFAKSLSLLDELILLDIYPARELPIPGVTSKIIFDEVTCKEKEMCSKENLLNVLTTKNFEVLITVGAGNIDRLVQPITDLINKR
ncbi:MAG: UDP-N-acetylmuramate--L-alanine ligase [Bacteroidales bacterium]|nr:UDP-N-acetylmuramate--L-alanine ligase [Bacteroidales bacterium]